MKNTVDDLAIFGGTKLFDSLRPISNILTPDIEQFLKYAGLFYDAHQITDNGRVVGLMEERVAELHKVEHCVSFCSGFLALQVAMKVCSLPGKTEIIMPSSTYRRMADIACWAGLIPHFCDIDPNSLGMTAKTAEKAINENTALILGAHPITNLCDIEGLERLSKDSGIPLIFDSVEAAYATHKGVHLGGFGQAEAFSLHASKLINGFEGGYLTTNIQSMADKFKCVRNIGFDNTGSISRLGLNSQLNEVHAAMTIACLDTLPEHIQRNRKKHETWQSILEDIPSLTPIVYDSTEVRGYKNVLVRIEDGWKLSRKNTLNLLHAENILARPYYNPPLHKVPRKFNALATSLPVTEKVTEQFLILPAGEFSSLEDISIMGDLIHFISSHADKISQRFVESDI